MGRKPISETGELLDDRIVVKSSKTLKKRFVDMCDAIGENPSAHIRTTIETELELYEDAKR